MRMRIMRDIVTVGDMRFMQEVSKIFKNKFLIIFQSNFEKKCFV